MISCIWSGGQTGADQSGLFAARSLSIPTGGYACKGWLVETPDGRGDTFAPWLADYGLVEHRMPLTPMPPRGSREWQGWRASAYGFRTRENAGASDGTIWFGTGDSTGYNKTRRSCLEFDRPFLLITEGITTPNDVRTWLENHGIRCLNVAGNRASRQPTMAGETPFADRVARFLVASLRGDQHVVR